MKPSYSRYLTSTSPRAIPNVNGLTCTHSVGEEITPKSSVAAMKKQYFLLSRLIHPDRLQTFPQATKAFQLLVSAYESLSQPDITKVDTAAPKTKVISRTNEGCYRTDVCCPRCVTFA